MPTINDLLAAHNVPGSGGGPGPYFGNGSDGTFNPSSNITFTSTQDGGPVVKQFTSVNIPSGVTVTVSNRCQGLIMLVNGNVTIGGTINMDSMAPLLDPTTTTGLAVADKVFQLYYPLGNNKFIPLGMGGAGGAGGAGGSVVYTNGSVQYWGGSGGLGGNGTWWGGGRGGGGGGGAMYASLTYNVGGSGGNGGSANSYTGAQTGGAASVNNSGGTTSAASSGNAGSNGGGGSGAVGEYASGYTATGGAGGIGVGSGGGGTGAYLASGTSTGTSASSVTGTGGGFILIIANGNVTINSGGVLTAKGANGGNGTSAYNYGAAAALGGGGGGGGAGGGIINILYKGNYSNSGTIIVAGGTGGTYGAGAGAIAGSSPYLATNAMNGFNGQNGTKQTIQL